MKTRILILTISVILFATTVYSQKTEATRLLEEQNKQFIPEIFQITENVHFAVGYEVSNIAMIEGETGIIIIDAGMSPVRMETLRLKFREITDKPIKGIIITHGHGDHFGGVQAFLDEGSNPQVWGRSGALGNNVGFNIEENAGKSAGLTYQNNRGARQAGVILPDSIHINNGIAPRPNKQNTMFNRKKGQAEFEPTHFFSGERKQINIDGIKFDLVAASGETYDNMYVWMPDQKILFCGDTFYKSFPNLYTIRGSQYRDVKSWYESIDKMVAEEPVYLLPGHTRPVIGKEKVNEILSNYSAAIKFVFDKTIEGMNKGLTPDQLVEYVKLPEHLASLPYLTEYYGRVDWGVRSIFNGYLGWFDGNPVNLNKLAPKSEAEKMAIMVGGKDKLRANALKAFKDEDFQWAAQLSDYLLALNINDKEIINLKADALFEIAKTMVTATGRNYMNSYAIQLKEKVGE
ncbi:alkyl sulfatase dimerization domain-containing protein [Saccharicrinis sp. 156]|uniref:alkyl sulfatase dimerization domain-containing protein n=1 Tax=Saccharicrinis sp. 156 TaxID=3417574 RepID=UPI003D32E017